jgi:hypothetical protein
VTAYTSARACWEAFLREIVAPMERVEALVYLAGVQEASVTHSAAEAIWSAAQTVKRDVFGRFAQLGAAG